MILNTEEAIVMWCPMDSLKSTCLSDNCPMWRWAERNERRVWMAENRSALTEVDAGPKPAFASDWVFVADGDSEDGACWVQTEAQAMAQRKGYCGLAGKVEFP